MVEEPLYEVSVFIILLVIDFFHKKTKKVAKRVHFYVNYLIF